jgi:formylglycine-generating enzyme required for sulfatase activity
MAGCVVAVLAGWGAPARANGIVVTNVALVNVGGGVADVQFDLSWSNGWNLTWADDGGSTTVTNHDAAWVFVKFRVGPGEWRHAWLAPTGHTATGGTRIDIGSNGGDTNVGAYVYLADTGAGPVNCTQMRLRWDYTRNGLAGTNSLDISVHGIEMVYVPRAPFQLGSGGSDTYEFCQYPGLTTPYPVANEESMVVGAITNALFYPTGFWSGGDEYGANHWRGGDGLGPIPAAFPKGYASIYCMKYEVTQGQFADYLSHAGGYAAANYPNTYGQERYTVRLTNGLYVADAPDRACNWFSWADLAAVLDWAALRPMTELEFEKVCRGPLPPVPLEYAWGNVSLTRLTGFNGSDGSGSETPLPASANCNCENNIAGPARAGLFATGSSIRYAAGAGYYGVMELGGNVYEVVISAGHPDGRAFAGEHGDGALAVRPATWPSPTSTGVQTRGGSYVSAASNSRISNRTGIVRDASYVANRTSRTGGRGVRSAP